MQVWKLMVCVQSPWREASGESGPQGQGRKEDRLRWRGRRCLGLGGPVCHDEETTAQSPI